ncbi:F-box domain protein [Talaromyces proteolyticus]|uniref:F-box domain protein n=1 Tax=Talaromyces proteolyticus TaxID=1131652 RepID=A0AAD4KFZ4_9EURO|nr:F-box domain protein [Talaromyces proteolyticus]KAH8691438.1 F-box domain protein [Talaromyces proteolyticus]
MADSNEAVNIYSLPNELLVQILTPFTTRSLLPLTSVSHRFHAIILRILHYRLLLAASLQEYKLILECFHPSSRLTDPHSFCTYLGTPGLSNNYEGKGSLYENCKTAEKLSRLSSVYSRFRPDHITTDQESRSNNVFQPPTGTNGVSENSLTGAHHDVVEANSHISNEIRFFKKQISLDEFESFSQLCTMVNLVKVANNSTRLLSALNVEEGVIRIYKDWLREQSKRDHINTDDSNLPDDDEGILWVDTAKNVGLKVRVKERRWNREAPILIHRDEELATTYEVEIEEIRIRTTRLLLTVEQSLAEQQNYFKAIIIGPVHSAAI